MAYASEFGKDIGKFEGYKYTGPEAKYSSIVANENISRNLTRLLTGRTLLDIGCGDGEFTVQYIKLGFDNIMAFDIESEAISFAKKKYKHLSKIYFTNEPLENFIDKKITFDCITIRGALHHMDDLKSGIELASKLGNKIVVAEPNGLNPILKIIEKVSKYHREHNEKSFTTKKLTENFDNYSFKRTHLSYCGIIPFFFPKILSKLFLSIQPFCEKTKIIRFLTCGTQILVFEKIN